jgi:hypothetical protein
LWGGGVAHDVDGDVDGDVEAADEHRTGHGGLLERIVHTSAETGIDSRLPVLLRDLVQESVDPGLGTDGFSPLVEVLLRPTAG